MDYQLEVGNKWPRICVDVRFPPLRPKSSSTLYILAALNGALLAAPHSDGSFQQYPNIAGHKQSRPTTSQEEAII